MKKIPLIVANWKMNMDQFGIQRFFSRLTLTDEELAKGQAVICPSFVDIFTIKNLINKRPLALGAQNLFWEEKGAYTGEVSAAQLAAAGCQYAIVGHSERRRLFNEDEAMVNRKIKVALKHKLKPIVCLGESYQEKDDGLTKKVLAEKISACLNELSAGDIKQVVIAYEPVWAISTSPENVAGLSDSPESAQVVHKYIRKEIAELFGLSAAEAVRIIYGGSVNPDNAAGFARMDDIDGVLVGSASREADSFGKIFLSFIHK